MRAQWGLIIVAACGGSSGVTTSVDADLSRDGAIAIDGARVADAPGTSDPDAPAGVDGPPMRVPCTTQLGSAMSTAFGRLDGILVAIVPAGASNCNGDASHVHLQVRANGATYDIAVNVGSGSMQDVHSTTRELALPGPAWSEGWHTNVSDDYVALGVHAADLPLQTAAQLEAAIDADLATANHVSVYATGYGPDGGHLVHRNGSGHDGLLITQPLSPTAHARLFSFSTQSF